MHIWGKVPRMVSKRHTRLTSMMSQPVVLGDTYTHTSRPLTQDEIDSIPLVHYIPPRTASIGPTLPSPQNAGSPSLSQNPNTRTHRFSFFRSRTTTGKSQIGIPSPRLLICSSTAAAEEQEQGLPYVVLQDNLAACSICCSDFEAPPAPALPPAVATSEVGGEAHELSVAVRPEYRVGELEVRIPVEPSLVNAGAADGAERTPLRLLGCGHAFHVRSIARDVSLARSPAVCRRSASTGGWAKRQCAQTA